MFAFSKAGQPLKVYGRKFPVFDAALIKKKRWRAVAETAKPIVYLPFTEDTFDPDFVAGGRDFLLSTAQQAIDELRLARAPSAAFPGELLADVVPTGSLDIILDQLKTLATQKTSSSGALLVSYERAGEVETGAVGPEYD